ncbi:hypothetical protein R1flu_007763 [Riccia fluitans]|uniref:Uncharacterized protein n=1 Tax=Riccia fluitans TaxID=41844 RepID=A0ABD1Z106_9MARC
MEAAEGYEQQLMTNVTMAKSTETTTTGDPRPSTSSHSDDEETFSQQQQQQGSGRRDARVVCETFTERDHHDHHFAYSSEFSKHNNSSHDTIQKRRSSKHFKRRGHAYSRNSLLACFIGESVLSQRSIRHHPNSDSANSQRAFFSLIPVDSSKMNEKTGEPSSPQISCIGQVKCSTRHAKARSLAQDMSQLDLSSDYHRPKCATKGSLTKCRSFDFAAAIADIPHLDLNEGAVGASPASAHCPRLMRSVKRPNSMDFSGLEKDTTTSTNGTRLKPSFQHLHQLLKQLLAASVFRFNCGFICGWYSREDCSSAREKDGEHYEIDLSRFASCDIQVNTPSFRETRGEKKLADIHVSQPLPSAEERERGGEVPKDEKFSSEEEEKVRSHPTIVIKVQGRRPSSCDSTLWKRRSMNKALTVEVKK